MIPLGSGPEFDLIRRFYAERAGEARRPDVRVEPGDDCAVVGEGIALSSDMSVEGVHFRRDWLTLREIGFRATSAALSDLAAMAARPIGVLVSIALPPGDAGAPAVELMDGAGEAAAAVGAAVLGGDTTRSPAALVIDVIVVGEAPAPVRRAGARPGDTIWVTGELGASAAAVRSLLQGSIPPGPLRRAFARPTPRTAEAQWLHERNLPRAMLDLSDGLAGDAAHLAAAGGVAVRLSMHTIPIHPALHEAGWTGSEALRLAVGGGEDYELLFAARPGSVEAYRDEFQERFAVPLTAVGRAVEGEGIVWEGEDGSVADIQLSGFQHFAG